ncbi:activated protein kinase catalytic subunit alpha-1 [Seminavis robusta]|uniref:Activated protein kinase catalytic subunit alpha-1 n=1 Tax=Seminavis robusta TaxID=568900 RepID=A0A9N8D9T4_9STRA|nr:activated protein kinase catalytic subunit alpha-1 [Seminavis robusta]|eukprot:Sro26_g017940.1 activated protein kinase catalytic subunit alpha-1 (889) ;mRNA; r:163569-166602
MSNKEERRTASTGTPGAHANLADRLDLLEARLRMPTHPNPPQPELKGIPPLSLDASLLDPLSSPAVSQQSFQFDAPTLSASSPDFANALRRENQSTQKGFPSATLEAVSRAAEEHMRKIAQQDLATTDSNSQPAFSNSSYQTVKRSHQSQQTAKIVKESPPELLEQPGAKKSKGSPRALNMDRTTASNNNHQRTSSKRKSTPVKLEPSKSKKQTRRQSSSTTNNKDNNDGESKRTKLQFSGTDTHTKSNHSSSEGNIQNHASAKESSSTAQAAGTLASANTNSRSNQTPVRTSTSGSTKHKPPKNNRLIRDFFSAVSASDNTKGTTAKNKASSQGVTEQQPTTPRRPSLGATGKFSNLAATPSPNQQVAQLQQKCRQMEQLCQEKEAQLKAVSNNRTILQTATQSALQQAKQELVLEKQKTASYRGQVGSVIEDLMRQQAFDQAQATRERLAADATRLGRIIYARVGMRIVENWEDGIATRRLKERRNDLLEQKQQLEERHANAQKNASNHQDADKENKEAAKKDKGTLAGEGRRIQSKLDAIEALESARFHLDTVTKKLQDLQAEEQQLKEEKVEHVRAWKRLNSEDASRFRDRRKLNDRYVLMSLLGKGGFSEVWRAFDVEALQEVAVKIHELDPRWSDEKKENYTKHVSREYDIHRSVRHPRVVSLLDVFEVDANSFCTVLELCGGTDLETILKQQGKLPEKAARAILLQILSGMNYLAHPSADGRRQGIIHYDLKPGNILFDAQGDAKITDFGLSKIVEHHDPGQSMELTSQGAGTYWYLPPECFIMEEDVTVRISNKVDTWSIGVIFYQMLYGKRPFGHGMTQDRLLSDHTMLNAKEVNFPQERSISDMAKEFIRSCLQYDQILRPTVAQLCELPYVLDGIGQ